MLRQNGLQQETETFRLVLSAYGTSENAFFGHVGLKSLP